MEAVDKVCQHCGHRQRVVQPSPHSPRCASCHRDMEKRPPVIKAFRPPAKCGMYSPCDYAKSLEARGEEDRGRRDQQITKLERLSADLLEALRMADEHLSTLYPQGAEQGDHLCVTVRAAIAEVEESMGRNGNRASANVAQAEGLKPNAPARPAN